jgi:cyclopropane fatty-acyl-phospholipid synthase-like methyltransferase
MGSTHGDMMGSRLRQSHPDDEAAYARDLRQAETYFRHNYLQHLPKSKSAPILEVGSGLGQFLTFCRTHGYTNVSGVDLSAANVAFCTERNLEVELADAFEYLAETSRSFKVIVMNDVIEHIAKARILPFLGRALARLEPGGVLILKTFNMADPIMGTHGRYADFTHEVGWTEESMREVLEQVGYQHVKVLPSNLYVFYANPLNYVALAISKAFAFFFRCYFRLNGRPTTKVFTKNLIAVAHKTLRQPEDT